MRRYELAVHLRTKGTRAANKHVAACGGLIWHSLRAARKVARQIVTHPSVLYVNVSEVTYISKGIIR